ncbi:hypothetical protein FC62_GL001000 [Amylolactobacillus amylotrophicus DSM 20534]|uniref:Uncharacterized protein n=3 Tax=Amylolactobacillus TaxID=2767876 RepID=A0A1L6XBS4_9LACO|nr:MULTISPECIES: hypothetical protein [Amylolactobacillus]APT18434.1 hypothetical protein LA20533_03745 [Amylolactobacillus amylophilus DSM 20533 = JCM 1125]KRK38221.1 hypothetical protein FC62_GL001000 [Amylolactobacillus amylotrophicus DSM 20534]KRM43137.1 hypothetical protein FD40_GL000145 [Amylolactobacillus amylophilus DSM 20533 = JCM 1125]GED80463.1 hypothetical protein LAM01_09360 [Amylolactobacillus amylophilus]
MTENEQRPWFAEIIAREIPEHQRYEERALLAYLQEHLAELDKRIEQKQQQIDGELWNHEGW